MDDLKGKLQKFSSLSIAVIGDICLDLYYFITPENSEISLETGLRTQSVNRFNHEAGGAGNVAVNLAELGAGKVDLYGVLGTDYYGDILMSLLSRHGVNCSFIERQEKNWDTNVYHKVYSNGREQPRFDMGNFNEVNHQVSRRILNNLNSHLSDYDAVIINEQTLRGFHDSFFQQELKKTISRSSCLWLTDCRHINSVYDGTIRKLNNHEAAEVYKAFHEPDQSVPKESETALWLSRHWNQPVVVTLGEEGALGVDKEGKLHRVLGINLIGPIDTVGAGDAFLAGLVLSLASETELGEALEIANITASVSVTKINETGHPAAAEVLERGQSPDYRYHSDIADDPKKSRYTCGGEVEIIEEGRRPFPKAAVFDHDGTISTLRQGWASVMEEFMIESVTGNSVLSSEESAKTRDLIRDTIEKTTGVQTIIQMQYLRELVISCGYLPENTVLEPGEYKELFNRKLMKVVNKRRDKFLEGRLNQQDLTIKGAVDFLEYLRGKGVTLYLASGTDQEDVREEAELLGYASLFNGGIYGSVGNYDCDPKKEVMERIVRSLPRGVSPNECSVFGDGPVEMREAVKRGFTAVGVISDEMRRYGANQHKRSRLILGGAMVLIPDFSCLDSLAEVLGWEYK